MSEGCALKVVIDGHKAECACDEKDRLDPTSLANAANTCRQRPIWGLKTLMDKLDYL